MNKPIMSDLDAINAIEDGTPDEYTFTAAVQTLIDSGTIWHLEEYHRRLANYFLAKGLVYDRSEQ